MLVTEYIWILINQLKYGEWVFYGRVAEFDWYGLEKT